MPMERGFAARMPRGTLTPVDRAPVDMMTVDMTPVERVPADRMALDMPVYRMPLDSRMPVDSRMQADRMPLGFMAHDSMYVRSMIRPPSPQHPVSGPPGYVRQGDHYVPAPYEREAYAHQPAMLPHQNPKIQFDKRDPRDPNYQSRFTLEGRDARYANQRPASREVDQSTLGVKPYHQREAARQSNRNPGSVWQNEPNASASGSDDLSVTLPSEHKEWQEMQFARDLISRMGPRARRAIPSSKDIILSLLDCFAFTIRWRASSTNEKIAASLVRFGRR